jgi:peptidoglycan/LPS O-acetylase OafA/YrhL
MVTRTSAHQFVTLDGLRGVAAIVMLTFHAADMTLRDLAPGSYLAVDLFFVLSGFILARVYQDRFDAGMTARQFLVIRLIRLYPLYLLGTIITVVLLAIRLALNPQLDVPGVQTLVAALLFLPTPERVAPLLQLYPLNFPAWSLFFELAINIGFALIARHLTDRRLGLLLGLGAILLVATAFHFGSLSAGMAWPNIAGGAGRVVYTFFAGVAVERLWRRGRFPSIAMPPMLGAAVVIALFAVPLAPWRPAFDSIVGLVVLPVLILACSRREPSGRTAAVFSAIGAASYALYMLHAPVRDWMIAAAPRLTGREFVEYGIPGTLVFMVVVYAAAVAADRWVDRPVRGMLGRMLAPARRLARP